MIAWLQFGSGNGPFQTIHVAAMVKETSDPAKAAIMALWDGRWRRVWYSADNGGMLIPGLCRVGSIEGRG